ncbi:MAG TPA: phospho-sugar mutase [Bacillota bacterium]|nr:phospho-sugar mutase [Bacillota bacterium]HOA15540.1 phospho-sugar mutase [Bacillota bacterium]
MSQAKAAFERWRKFACLDPELKAELEAIKNDAGEIEERFGAGLEFGTAGLRGVIAAGTNRMNIYTVRKASLGLARFVNKNAAAPRSIAIAYDNRRKSRLFAEESARVFAANGIKALLFTEIQPTPLLSFAVQHHSASAGVMVTASHNPKEYNGYKVYWKHGGQVVDEYALAIQEEFNAIEDELSIETVSLKEAEEKGLFEWLGDETKDAYMDRVMGLLTRGDAITRHCMLPLVYTPLHGTGAKLVPEALMRAGFKGIRYVQSQMEPDTEFGAVKKPNPEDPDAFKEGLRLAKECGADLIIATDPDADRLGAMSREADGTFRLITGNQMGALLVDHLLSKAALSGRKLDRSVMIKTIVTSDLGASVARKKGVEVVDVLTGFKYIGELIDKYERTGEKEFLFGYEESYGYLAGGFVKDKDAVQIALLVAEMAAVLAEAGMTLGSKLDDLYAEHGYFVDEVVNISFEGLEGQRKIRSIMASLRSDPPFVMGANRIVMSADYLDGTIRYADGRSAQRTGLPSSNVLKFTLEDGSWVTVRPSGTEPKLKIYIGAQAREKTIAAEKASYLKHEANRLVSSRN